MSNQNPNNRSQNQNPEIRAKQGENSPGNFKNDPERAREAGRKGGESTHGERGRE
ncbi:MAG: general stress protein [Bdellovibrionales bacterium]